MKQFNVSNDSIAACRLIWWRPVTNVFDSGVALVTLITSFLFVWLSRGSLCDWNFDQLIIPIVKKKKKNIENLEAMKQLNVSNDSIAACRLIWWRPVTNAFDLGVALVTLITSFLFVWLSRGSLCDWNFDQLIIPIVKKKKKNIENLEAMKQLNVSNDSIAACRLIWWRPVTNAFDLGGCSSNANHQFHVCMTE